MTDLDKYIMTKDMMYLHSWVEDNYSMFFDIALKFKRRYAVHHVDLEEIISECVISFYESIDRYDPALSKPTTYIYRAVEYGVLNKLKSYRNRDFTTRVPTFSMDQEVTEDGTSLSYREVLSDDAADVMSKIMIDELREYMENYEDGLAKDVYNLYIHGYTITDIAKELGFTKQHISKVLQNLVAEIRLDWRVQ